MNSDDEVDVTLTVTFLIRNDEAVAALAKRAAEVDDDNQGVHQTSYTLTQALIVVLHTDPKFLFTQLSGVVRDRI